MKNVTKNINPWLWIPTLYFAEGIPYFIVNNISVILFTRMGVPNGEMALFTSLIYFPWVIKPLWSPFVDILRTKRWWIVMMQIVMSIAFILLTFSIPHPSPDVISASTCLPSTNSNNRSSLAFEAPSIDYRPSSDKAFWCMLQVS